MGPLICIQNFTELPQTQPSTLSQKAGLWMFVWEKSGIAFPVASFCLISKSSFNSEYFCMCGGYMWGCVCACVCSEMSEVDRVSSHSLPVLWGRLSHCTWSLLPLFSPPTKLDCSQQAPNGILLSLWPQCWHYRHAWDSWCVDVGAGIWTLTLRLAQIELLTTKPSLQFLILTFYNLFLKIYLFFYVSVLPVPGQARTEHQFFRNRVRESS